MTHGSFSEISAVERGTRSRDMDPREGPTVPDTGTSVKPCRSQDRRYRASRLGRDNASGPGACTQTRRVHSRTGPARRIIPLGAATGRDTNVNVSVNATGRRAAVRAFRRRRGARNVIGTRPGESRWGSYDTHGPRPIMHHNDYGRARETPFLWAVLSFSRPLSRDRAPLSAVSTRSICTLLFMSTVTLRMGTELQRLSGNYGKLRKSFFLF